MAEDLTESKGGLRRALARLRSENDPGPDPEAILAETMQIISDCVDGISVKVFIADIGPEFRSLVDNRDGDSITNLVRLLGRLDFEELIGQAVTESINRNGAGLNHNALALLDISIDWNSENGPTLSFGGLIDDSDRLYAWESPLCSEPWISWAKKNHMTLDDLEFVLGVKRGSGRLRSGDMVVIVGKAKRYPVFSAFDIDFVKAGDVGKILKIKEGEIVVGFSKKGEGAFNPSELSIAHSKVFSVKDFSEGEWVMLNPRLLEEVSLGNHIWPEDLLEEKGRVVRVDRKDSTILIRFTKKRDGKLPDSEWISRRLAVPTGKPEVFPESK